MSSFFMFKSLKMKCEFWVNVNKVSTNATALAANKLISVAHVILVNANECSKKIPMGS